MHTCSIATMPRVTKTHHYVGQLISELDVLAIAYSRIILQIGWQVRENYARTLGYQSQTDILFCTLFTLLGSSVGLSVFQDSNISKAISFRFAHFTRTGYAVDYVSVSDASINKVNG